MENKASSRGSIVPAIIMAYASNPLLPFIMRRIVAAKLPYDPAELTTSLRIKKLPLTFRALVRHGSADFTDNTLIILRVTARIVPETVQVAREQTTPQSGLGIG